MLKPRIKAIFVLLLATIVIMAVTVKNTPPVSEYMQTGIRLSDLPDKECVAFMASKGAHMPGHYKQSLYFPAATKDYITTFEQNPYKTLRGVYSDTSTNQYVEDVRKIVNDYYGIYHVEYYLDHDPEYSSVGAEQ